MAVGGVVRVWHEDEGWGVVDSSETPGGCWAHFSSVLVPGYRALRAGQSVILEHEQDWQDGFAFRAVEVWPAGHVPHRVEVAPERPPQAYRSSLSVTFDRPEEPEPQPPP